MWVTMLAWSSSRGLALATSHFEVVVLALSFDLVWFEGGLAVGPSEILQVYVIREHAREIRN